MYLATITRIAYLCNEEKHTISYSKHCRTYEVAPTINSYKQAIGNTEAEVLENLRIYLKSLMAPCKLSDFSISIRINEVPESGVFWNSAGYHISKTFND